RAAVYTADGKCNGFEWIKRIHPAGFQMIIKISEHINGRVCQVRPGTVAAVTVYSDIKHESTGHPRAWINGYFPGRDIRLQMDAPYTVCADFENSRQYADNAASVFLTLFKSEDDPSAQTVFIF